MASNRQMLAEGHAKRADLVKILIEHIHVEDSFNAPESSEDFEARVEGIVAHLAAGGKLPPVEVRDRRDGGVFLVDGHARLEGTRRAAESGIPVHDPKDGLVYLLTTAFVGNDADRSLRIITSATGRTLSPLQTAAILKRLRNFGWSPKEIGGRVNLSAERVRQLLALGDSNSDVQSLVQSGEVPAAVAIKAQRKHKDAAGSVLTAQLADAKACGKKRLTTAAVDGKKVKASELETERQRLDFLVKNFAIVHCDGRENLTAAVPGARGYWVEWLAEKIQQAEVYASARKAIDAAISAKQATQPQQNEPT